MFSGSQQYCCPEEQHIKCFPFLFHINHFLLVHQLLEHSVFRISSKVTFIVNGVILISVSSFVLIGKQRSGMSQAFFLLPLGCALSLKGCLKHLTGISRIRMELDLFPKYVGNCYVKYLSEWKKGSTMERFVFFYPHRCIATTEQ